MEILSFNCNCTYARKHAYCVLANARYTRIYSEYQGYSMLINTY